MTWCIRGSARVGLALLLITTGCGQTSVSPTTAASTPSPQAAVTSPSTMISPSPKPAPSPSPLGAPSPAVGVSPGERTAGQVRTLPNELNDQRACHQLGRTDRMQDKAAGVSMNPNPPVSPPGSSRVRSGEVLEFGIGPSGERVVIATAVEDGAAKAQVRAGNPNCGSAYIDGYMDAPFRQR